MGAFVGALFVRNTNKTNNKQHVNRGYDSESGTTYSENPAYGWVFAFLHPNLYQPNSLIQHFRFHRFYRLLHLFKLLAQGLHFIAVRNKYNAVSGNLHCDTSTGVETSVFEPFPAQVKSWCAGAVLVGNIADGVAALGFAGFFG